MISIRRSLGVHGEAQHADRLGICKLDKRFVSVRSGLRGDANWQFSIFQETFARCRTHGAPVRRILYCVGVLSPWNRVAGSAEAWLVARFSQPEVIGRHEIDNNRLAPS